VEIYADNRARWLAASASRHFSELGKLLWIKALRDLLFERAGKV
jgi:hypothetical protein